VCKVSQKRDRWPTRSTTPQGWPRTLGSKDQEEVSRVKGARPEIAGTQVVLRTEIGVIRRGCLDVSECSHPRGGRG
jgi:hypothetical protein